MLKLMYITNDLTVAKIAEQTGIDRIFVDLEYLGKEKRQKNLDTVKSKHCEDDVSKIAGVLKKSELLVRINPINPRSKKEVDSVIEKGADRIMLPMFKTRQEVELFLKFVNGRVPTILLLEHIDAVQQLDSILEIEEIDEIHIGLNDLHLSMHLNFMFELLIDGTVENIVKKISAKDIPFGIGGISRIGDGLLPAELIIAEHYRLGSQAAILSRSFCNTQKEKDYLIIESVFREGVNEIREYEKTLENENEEFFIRNYETMKTKINAIAGKVKETPQK